MVMRDARDQKIFVVDSFNHHVPSDSAESLLCFVKCIVLCLLYFCPVFTAGLLGGLG